MKNCCMARCKTHQPAHLFLFFFFFALPPRLTFAAALLTSTLHRFLTGGVAEHNRRLVPTVTRAVPLERLDAG